MRDDGSPSASGRNEATIVLSGTGTALSEGMLMNMYRTYGPIVRVRHNGTNSAQVIFAQKAHALKAVQATNGAVVYGKTLKVSLQRQFKKTTEPCRGFVAGICRKGDMCKYYHVTDDAAFAAPDPRDGAKTTCKPKRNDPKVPASAATLPPEIQAIPDKKAVSAPVGKVARPCLFFQNGVCARGDACRYVHEPIAGAAAPAHSSAPSAIAQSNNSDEESESEAERSDENRTCIECEKPDVAVWKCTQCDDSLYCEDCDSTVHRARVMAKHKRINLPSLPRLPRCGECESKTASVRCEQCEVPFCTSCDASVHKFKSLRKHVRVKVAENTKKTQPNATKSTEELVAAKKEKKKTDCVVEPVPQTKVNDPLLYVESVPQLEFSSDSTSDSEDEEMEEEVSPLQSNGDETMIAPDPSNVESDEDFDDLKPLPLVPVTSVPVGTAQVSQLSGSKYEDNVDDKPAIAKSTTACVSVPKMELSSDSDSSGNRSSESTQDPASASKDAVSSESEDDFENEALSNSAAKTTAARKSVLAAISSESESDSNGEAPPVRVVKQAKKLVQKTKVPSGSSNGSKHEVPSKLTAKRKATPALKFVEKEATSTSSSSESSDSPSVKFSGSSKDKGPPLKSTTPAPLGAPVRACNNTTGGISAGSSHTLVKKIEAYNESRKAGDLHLDANLNGFERLLAHDCAERLGLAHESIGSGLERHIIISRHGRKRSAAHSSKGLKSKKSKHRRV